MRNRSIHAVAQIATFGALALVIGCSSTDSAPTETADELKQVARRAIAKIIPTSSTSTVSGTVEFVEDSDGVRVAIQISGATPGVHGMHIHQNGSCDAIDGGAGLGAGGHWNPMDAGHGLPSAEGHHAEGHHYGDLGNVTVDGKGNASATVTSNEFYVRQGASSVVGHAVIFHEKQDDGSQPTGNAGARPGCGVIERVQDSAK